MPVSAAELKTVACNAIEQVKEQLNDVSQDIWKHPELLFEEHRAHDTLCNFMESQGFPVERHYVLDTAFLCVYGDSDKPHVSVLCEYEALPEIGHACGHNLIAEVRVGAGVGIKAALDAAKATGTDLGRVVILGTPAEEGGVGKTFLLEAGAFIGADLSVMAHPSLYTNPKPGTLALDMVKFFGKTSHASASPWEGVNALDAAVMAYNNISCFRQQMKPSWKIHGVITNGGTKPNIIPEESAMEYYVRTPTLKELRVLKERAISCFAAAATATGCKVEIKWDPKPYYNLITNKPLADIYEQNAREIGVDFSHDLDLVNRAQGSTDMGNVSHVVPAIHPMFYIGTDATGHTRQFQVAAGKSEAQEHTLNQAKSLAMTAIDIFCRPELLDTIRCQFQEDITNDT